MGSRMAARLVDAGHEVSVWDRNPAAVAALAERGARATSDPAALPRDAEIVVTMLWDDDVAEAIVERTLLPAARPGTTFIEMTTLSPAMQRRLAGAAKACGCPFLDAPVTGSKDAAERGELTALVGGDATVLAANRDVLGIMVSNVIHVGPNGASGALKLGNNQLIALMAAAWGESLATAQRGGADPRLALEMYAGTFARVAEMKRATLVSGDFAPHFTLDALLKDLHAAARTAAEAGLDLPLLRAVIPLYEAAVADGAARQDFSIIVPRIADGAAAPKEAIP